MKKFLSVILSVVMVVATLFACAPKPAATTEAAAETAAETSAEKTGYNVTVILKTLSSEYWGYVEAGCKQYEKDHPEVKVTVMGPPSETSFDEQVTMIETALGDTSVDGYVFAPLQSDTVANLIKGQTKPMVAVDTNVDAPEILSFIGTGNEEAAALGGKEAVALAKSRGWEKIECIEISGVQGDTTNTARLNGYTKGVNEAGGTFLSDEVHYADGVADKAVTEMEGIISAHPEGVAIICANNDDMAQAAARTAAGNEAYKNTVFMGFDGTMSACNSILKGEETMSVAQEPFEMGYKSVEAVMAAINGQTLNKFIDSGASVVTPDNAEARYNQLASYLGQPKFAGASASAGSDKELNISVILKTLSSEYWGYVEAGCKQYEKDHPNVKVTVMGPPSETSFDEQVTMIETALGDTTIDGYAFAPLQSDTVANLIKGQTKPMVAVDTNVDAPEILSFIGTGNEEAAALGGKEAVALAKSRGWEKIECIEISGVQGDTTNTARLNGYTKGVNEAGGTFLSNEVHYADGVADKAVTEMEGIISAHPEGVAIICANNDDMAQAAARTAAGNEAYKNTVFMGFDGTLSACDSILKGEETMSVAQEPFEMGYKAVEALVKSINGESLDKFIDSGASVVTPDNAQTRKDQLNKYLGK